MGEENCFVHRRYFLCGRMEDVIAYIEEHLVEKPDPKQIAEAVHYSKYNLHRMFTNTTGMALHDYIQRRQLTEAEKLQISL